MVFQSIRQQLTIEFADGVKVGYKLICIKKIPHHFELKILLWMGNADAIVLSEALEEMHTLMDQPIPGLTFFVIKRGVTEGPPLPM